MRTPGADHSAAGVLVIGLGDRWGKVRRSVLEREKDVVSRDGQVWAMEIKAKSNHLEDGFYSRLEGKDVIIPEEGKSVIVENPRVSYFPFASRK